MVVGGGGDKHFYRKLAHCDPYKWVDSTFMVCTLVNN